jgi:predicted nucleic acid-binding protein
MFLLDTNVVSELRRPQPNRAVTDWFDSKPRTAHYLSAISLTELSHGAAAHPDPTQRHEIQRWIDTVLRIWFPARILEITIDIAESAGQLIGLRQRAGKPLAIADALIGATAIKHRLVLVTRNGKDFVDLPLDVFDPWLNTLTLGVRTR